MASERRKWGRCYKPLLSAIKLSTFPLKYLEKFGNNRSVYGFIKHIPYLLLRKIACAKVVARARFLSFALVPTFSPNLRGNACYAGYTGEQNYSFLIDIFSVVFPSADYFWASWISKTKSFIYSIAYLCLRNKTPARMNHLRVTVICKGYHLLVSVLGWQPGARFSRLISINVYFVAISHEIVASWCRSIQLFLERL